MLPRSVYNTETLTMSIPLVFFYADGKNHCNNCGRTWSADPQPGRNIRDRPQSGKKVNPAMVKKLRAGRQPTVKLTTKGIEVLKAGLPSDSVTVVVLDVFRYIVDQQAKRALRIDADPQYQRLKDGFDILISDGESKLNIAMHPSLTASIAKGLIQPYSVLKLTQWRGWYNDLELLNDQPTQVVLVSELQVVSQGYFLGITGAPIVPPAFQGFLKKPFSRLANALDGQALRPLFGSRNYYVNFFSDATVAFPTTDLTVDFDVSTETVEESTFLAELAQGFLHPKKTKRSNQLPTRVWGRVMKKTAVNHYAKAADEKGSYPMNFSFFIADDSGVQVRVVCWNTVCKNTFSSIDIGDIVIVDSFKCKKAFYDQPTRPLNNMPQSRPELLELAVNPSAPVGHVWKIPPNDAIEAMFPLLENNIYTLDKVVTCADGSSVDIFGIVVFVGRIQVDQVARNSYTQWRQRECYRWIKLQDEHRNEVSCKVYANTQWPVFVDELFEGQIMLLKEFRVHSITPSARARDRVFWCSSSPYSRIFSIGGELGFDAVLGSHIVEYALQNKEELNQLAEYRASQKLGFTDTVVVPVTTSVALYSEVFPRTEVLLLSDLPKFCDDLDLLEYQTYFLHHYIKNLTFDGVVQQVTTLDQDGGSAKCVPFDRVICNATVCDLNETSEAVFQVAFDTDAFLEITDHECAKLFLESLEHRGIALSEQPEALSVSMISQLLWRQKIRFHSLVSIYRGSSADVERCVYIAEIFR